MDSEGNSDDSGNSDENEESTAEDDSGVDKQIADVGADYVPNSENDFEYQLNDMKNAVIITEYTGSSPDINVPKTIEGYPVESIGLREGLIWDSIEELRDTKIRSVTIPHGIVDNSNYCYCVNLEKYTTYSEEPQGVFVGCEALKEVNYVNEVHEVNGGSYRGVCDFRYCRSLKKIKLNFDVGSITFEGCTALEEVETSGEVVFLSNSESYGCFKDCTSLKKIDLSNWESIPEGAFFNCTGLTEITIPDSLLFISRCAFMGCTNLKTINFTGTSYSIEPFAFGYSLKEGVTPSDEYGKFDVNNITANNLNKIDGVVFHTTGKLSDAHAYSKENGFEEVMDLQVN